MLLLIITLVCCMLKGIKKELNEDDYESQGETVLHIKNPGGGGGSRGGRGGVPHHQLAESYTPTHLAPPPSRGGYHSGTDESMVMVDL